MPINRLIVAGAVFMVFSTVTKIMKKEGDTVESLSGSNAMIGIVLLKFSSNDEMHTKMNNMDEYIKVVIQ